MTDKSIPIMFRANEQDQAVIQSIREHMERTMPGVTFTQADIIRYALSAALEKLGDN